MLTLVPLVQTLSRDSSRDRKQQSNIRVVEVAKKMIENEKAIEGARVHQEWETFGTKITNQRHQWRSQTLMVHLHSVNANTKANFLLSYLLLLNVNIKLDSLWTHLEAMSALHQTNQTNP